MKTLSIKTILLALLAVAVLGFLVFTQSPWAQSKKTSKTADEFKSSSPSIVWTPDHLNIDGDDTVSVTLTARSQIPATQIEIVPSLAPYLSVSPVALPALAKGATQRLQITAKVPAGTPMDTIDGTLHVRLKSSTIARPLPITLNTWPAAVDENLGISLNYPPSWHRIGNLAFSNVPAFSDLGDSIPTEETYFSVSSRPGENPQALPIDQWFSQVLAPNLPSEPLSVTTTTVAGRQAILARIADIGTYVYVFIPIDTDVLEVVYRSSQSYAPLYEAMLKSLEF